MFLEMLSQCIYIVTDIYGDYKKASSDQGFFYFTNYQLSIA